MADGIATGELSIVGVIGYGSASEREIQHTLKEMGNVSAIDVRLSSHGGSAFEGIGIYNALKNHPAEVTVRVASVAASAASIIAMAGNRIVMETGASMMVHRGSYVQEGNVHAMREAMDLLNNLDEAMASVYAARTGKGNAKAWLAAMDKTTWFSGAESVKAGLADSVVGGPESKMPTADDLAAMDPLASRFVPGPPVSCAEFLDWLKTNITPGAKPDSEPVVDAGFSFPVITRSLIPPMFQR